jgi:opacity protein-like surface antigen
VLGGVGFAHMTPTAAFAYTDGTLPNADPTVAAPTEGSDVTDPIVSAGLFTQPAASNAFLFQLGGGIDVSVAKHWSVDTQYRFSRVSADTPLHANGVTFGVGYKF